MGKSPAGKRVEYPVKKVNLAKKKKTARFQLSPAKKDWIEKKRNTRREQPEQHVGQNGESSKASEERREVGSAVKKLFSEMSNQEATRDQCAPSNEANKLTIANNETKSGIIVTKSITLTPKKRGGSAELVSQYGGESKEAEGAVLEETVIGQRDDKIDVRVTNIARSEKEQNAVQCGREKDATQCGKEQNANEKERGESKQSAAVMDIDTMNIDKMGMAQIEDAIEQMHTLSQAEQIELTEKLNARLETIDREIDEIGWKHFQMKERNQQVQQRLKERGTCD